MNSNYSAARQNLEKAYDHLQDNDETSQKMREAIGILIDALVTKQFTSKAQVLPFPPGKGRSPRSPETPSTSRAFMERGTEKENSPASRRLRVRLHPQTALVSGG